MNDLRAAELYPLHVGIALPKLPVLDNVLSLFQRKEELYLVSLMSNIINQSTIEKNGLARQILQRFDCSGSEMQQNQLELISLVEMD